MPLSPSSDESSSVSSSPAPTSLAPTSLAPTSQWQRLLKNAGTWQGSFTQMSVSGQVLSDAPTEVALIPQDEGKAMHQEVRRYTQWDYSDEPNVQAFDYRSLNRATLVFAEGAFSHGSMQWAPFSEFGAELGLISGERRLRLLPIFDKTNTFKQLTLIRERLQGSQATERAPLQIADLFGTWQGEAVTQYADLRPEQTQKTQLVLEPLSSSEVRQSIVMPGLPPISSTGTLKGKTIEFESGVTVMLLPDGGSATFPLRITPRQPLFLEAGWLLDANTRQRMIRSYDASGAWVSLTLVTEHKV
ncbi:MAG: DUF3598 family protein [Cyanobacteria bacterium P01_F01_bin.53]